MRRAIALLSVPLLVAGGVLVSAMPSTASGTEVNVGGLPDAGIVTIQTGFSGGLGKVTTVLEGKGSTVQEVSNGTCDALDSGPVDITAAGEDRACFRNLGFGVNPGRDGLPWWQGFLNPNTKSGEQLTVSITAEDVLFRGDVSLDIEAISTSSAAPAIELTTSLNGVTLEVIDVPLVNRVVNWPPNYREAVSLAKAADSITFTAVDDTRFQLEGDTDGKKGSSFELARVTDVVSCDGGTAEVDGATLTVNGGDGCTDEPVVFEREGNEISLLKDPSDADFTIVVDWNDPSGTAAYPGRATQIDYFDGVGFQNMVFCDVSGEAPALPGDQILSTEPIDGWCIADREIPTDNGDGTFTTTEILYGKGDPRMR